MARNGTKSTETTEAATETATQLAEVVTPSVTELETITAPDTPSPAPPTGTRSPKNFAPGNNTIVALATSGFVTLDDKGKAVILVAKDEKDKDTGEDMTIVKTVDLLTLVGITANGVERAGGKGDPLAEAKKAITKAKAQLGDSAVAGLLGLLMATEGDKAIKNLPGVDEALALAAQRLEKHEENAGSETPATNEQANPGTDPADRELYQTADLSS